MQQARQFQRNAPLQECLHYQCNPRSLLALSRFQRTVRVTAIAKKQRQKASKTAKEVLPAGPVQRVLEAQDSLQQSVDVKKLLTQSLLVGLTFGTAFQVTHNNGLLPIYDLWPIKIGPFLESGVVPLVLAPIWLLYGYLYPLLDEVFRADAATTEAQDRASTFSTLAITWALAAGQFILSDVLYLADTPHWQIYPVMAVCTAFIWAKFDRTKTGLILGALLAIGAPAGEAVIANGLHWWHYARPDTPYLDVCYWTAFCYASYAYGVGNFARWEVARQRSRKPRKVLTK